MKRFIVPSLIISLLLSISCVAQEKNEEKNQEAQLPKTHVKVQKEFDEHGNLIRLDSTYSYMYSSGNMDSLSMENFMRNFGSMSHFSRMDSLFNGGPRNMQLFFQNFFEDDFFRQPFNRGIFEDFLKKSDSIQKATSKKATLPIR